MQLDLAEFLNSEHHVQDFFQKQGEANDNKHVTQWNREGVEQQARERVGKSTFLVRDLFEKLMKSSGINEKVRFQITNTLQDIAWRDPGETEVTADNVSKLLSDAHIPEHSQQDAYWTNLRSDLEEAAASLPEESQPRILVETIKQAAERSGLFNAIDTLLSKKENK